jgi:hypothetical protein
MRRGDPKRINEAKLAGLRNRIRDAWHAPGDRADELLAAWHAEAATRDLVSADAEYWSQAEHWIEEQLGRTPGGR